MLTQPRMSMPTGTQAHHGALLPGRRGPRRRAPCLVRLVLGVRVGLLCGALAASLPCQLAGASTPEPLLEVQEAELRETEQRLDALRERLTDRERYREALHSELERAAREVNELLRTERELARRVEAQDAKVAGLMERLVHTQDELTAARAALVELIRSAYQFGPGDRLRLILDQQDPGRMGRQLGYYRALARARAARIVEVKRLASELQDLKRLGERESEELAMLAEHQRLTREALEGAQRARTAVLADMDEAIEDDRARVEELDANATALRELVEELRRRAKIADEIEIHQAPIMDRFGKLPLPVTGATLVQHFGRDAQPGDLHADGVLFAVPEGREVFPVHHGQVVHADWLRGFGLLLVIDHGDGYMSFYGHNQALFKEVGEWVGPDEAVALCGTWPGGRPAVAPDAASVAEPEAAGGRLYFALRKNGAPVDPAGWFGGGPG